MKTSELLDLIMVLTKIERDRLTSQENIGERYAVISHTHFEPWRVSVIKDFWTQTKDEKIQITFRKDLTVAETRGNPSKQDIKEAKDAAYAWLNKTQ